MKRQSSAKSKISEIDALCKIENVEEYVNNLSEEEVNAKLNSYSSICKDKLTELKNLITLSIPAIQPDLEESVKNPISFFSPLPKKNNFNDNEYIKSEEFKIGLTEDKNIFTNSDDFNTEENESLIRIKYSKKISDLETEYRSKLEKAKENLKQEYKEKLASIGEEQEKKVNNLTKEIEQIQSQIQILQNESKFITKAEHEKIKEKLILDNTNEVDDLKKQIEEYEHIIKEKYSSLISTDNSNIYIPKFDKEALKDEFFEDKVDVFLNQLKNNLANTDKIILISTLTDNKFNKSFKESIIRTETNPVDSEYDCLETEADININPIINSSYQIMINKNNTKSKKKV